MTTPQHSKSPTQETFSCHAPNGNADSGRLKLSSTHIIQPDMNLNLTVTGTGDALLLAPFPKEYDQKLKQLADFINA